MDYNNNNDTTSLFKHLLFVFTLFLLSCADNDIKIYKDASQPIESRVDDLLGRMTLEEKFWQLFMIPGDLSDGREKYKHGIFGFQIATKGKSSGNAEQLLDYSEGGTAKETAILINDIQKYFIEETRLGIPIIPFDEALHGLIREGATTFPQSIGLAASFNTPLMSEVAKAIAMETKTRGIRQVLSPVINIARDVRWGRTEETYGEDPFLTSEMAVAYISPFEKLGVLTTPKHFVSNVGDGGRDSYPIHFNDRLMEEIYFPAFKASVQKAKAWSIMTSYNSYDGTQATANNWLLNTVLKKDWGFDGFVISDAGATGGANVLHFTAKNYEESTQQAIEAGLDVIFQTSYKHYPLFYKAFETGMIKQTAIDEAVRRVLRAKFKLGLFEDPYINPEDASKWNANKEHRLLARKAAHESVVLLKNEAQTLPFSKDIKSIAVIGTDAIEARLGGYSGPGNESISILKGLQNKFKKGVNIKYVAGPGRSSDNFQTIPSEYLYTLKNGEKKQGLEGRYYNNIKLSGTPDLIRVDSKIDFRWTLFSPDQEKINYDYYSVQWNGNIRSPKTGMIDIGIKGDDGYRLYINNKLILDNWKKQSVQQLTVPYYFEKGKSYAIKIEYYETIGNVWFKLIWNAELSNSWQEKINKAVAIAKNSDVAVVCVGIEEGEFKDRAYLSLPGHQESLIKAVAATGKPMVVVLVGGSAITMDAWSNHAQAIVDVWYPGDEGGSAIADVLFGDYNPAGRLPITFPVHEAQLPLYYNHKPTGRGDDYINLTGKPLFPFGFGLSYTSFDYSDIQLENQTINTGEKTRVTCKVTNTGNYDGDEVVQLYIKDLFATVARPIIELKGFQRIHLKKGETKEVTFDIDSETLKMLNKEMKWVVEPGDFRVLIGTSSNNIQLRTTLKVVK
ncbi:beta-glucosidase [Polaribacter pacificus]|uniref:Beta-glucosidase n=1 Tax=Polaribacter pacificus TaxID=1775173 RepID=A0A917MDU6_9FLAO|nr:glycoside hydrolase family 3 C-terminal domain-containing protein [Polaribacter pacificus]GGG98010.1 beta-glucosidase [Polaribacter pacificus]